MVGVTVLAFFTMPLPVVGNVNLGAEAPSFALAVSLAISNRVSKAFFLAVVEVGLYLLLILFSVLETLVLEVSFSP